MDPENILKGRMGESLVEELLKKSGNKVYRFGYEAVLQNLTQLEESFNRESEVGQRIRSIPDFIVVNGKNILLIEVKFRTDPIIYEKDIKKLNRIIEFWKAKIVLLTPQKPYFRVSNSPYLNEKGEWSWIAIEDDKDLKIDKNTLNEFYKIIEKYFNKNSKN